ncbi:MAG: aldo/keto reductase, partial [Gallionella sp.]
FQGENFDHNRRLVGRVEAIAREKGVTPSQLVLAWLLAQGADVVPIPGTKRIAYLEENLGALCVRLSADDRGRIDEAMPSGAAKGGRYPDAQLRGVYL